MSDEQQGPIRVTLSDDQATLQCERCGNRETQPLDQSQWQQFSEVAHIEQDGEAQARCEHCGNQSSAQPDEFDGNSTY